MNEYRAPVADQAFVLETLCELEEIARLPGCEDITPDLVGAILESAGTFASQVLSPLNAVGDREGAELTDQGVREARGFAAAYAQLVEQGWPGIAGDPAYGGQGMPHILEIAVMEVLQSANMAFGLCPMLSQGAIAALASHGSSELRDLYLPKLVSGEWTGTMNLTEPQAGSDLAAVRARAVPREDHYLISGQKIFITWGDHGMAGNVLHLVLARLPDAPPGTRGISLFLVPKYLVASDGSPGERNDVHAVSLEHKLGIHGSPTCVMSFGDNGGAVGYLVGERHRGLHHMFTMMNHARLNVGLQGVAISERACQLAADYARERVQGGGQTIVNYPDVRRMLMLMRSSVEAMRAITYTTLGKLDIAHRSDQPTHSESARQRVDLMTPIVKGWCTEMANEVTSLGIQVHGGMGFIEEAGAARCYRDARILAIYEGTNGIQALDLVDRKLLKDQGGAIKALLEDMRSTAAELEACAALGARSGALGASLDHFSEAVDFIIANREDTSLSQAVAFNFLMLAGYVTGGWQMARAAIAVRDDDSAQARDKRATSAFYFDHLLSRSAYHLQVMRSGAGSVMDIPEARL